MFELAQMSGERRFRNTGNQALSYERCHFVKEQGNWPDFREGDSLRRPPAEPNCGVAWCHGAPGIGLSRLRVFELTKDQIAAREAEIAGTTTMRYLAMPADFTSRLFAVSRVRRKRRFLLEAARVLKNGAFRQLLKRLAVRALLRMSNRALRGLAVCWAAAKPRTCCLAQQGISLFYLRLDQPHVAPVLMVGPNN